MALQSLYNTKSKPAKREDIQLTPKKEKEKTQKMRVSFSASQDDRETLGYLAQSLQEASDSRPSKRWEIQYKQFIAQCFFREDGYANINLPIEQAVIRSKVADLVSMKPIMSLLPTERSDIHKRELLKVIMDFVWVESDMDYQLMEFYYTMCVYGTAFWFEGVCSERYTRYTPKLLKTGEVIGEPVTTVRTWMGGYPLDIRDVYLDPVSRIDDAKWVFIRERNVSYDQVVQLLDDPNYNKEQVQALINSISPDNGNTEYLIEDFVTTEEQLGLRTNKFSLMHYYNKEKGMYIVTDEQFQFILREGVNPYPHGELPVSLCVEHLRPLELYGIGDCELLESTKYERNQVRNQIVDYVRESNTMNFAIGDGVTFEDSEMVSSVMRVWNFNGNLGSAQFLKPPAQDGGLLNLEQIFSTDGTWITGIDVNSLAGAPTKTAFEARLQEQNKLKGVAVTMKNIEKFLTRVLRQRLANVQFFMPATTGRKIIGDEKLDKYRRIPITGYEQMPAISFDKDMEPFEDGIMLKKAKGEIDFLELSPSTIKNTCDIQVVTPSTTPILRELDRQDMNEILNTLISLAQFPEGQKLLSEFDFRAYYRDSIEQKGFNPDDYLKDPDLQNDPTKLREMIRKDLPLPPKMASQPNIAGRGGQGKYPQTPPAPKLPFTQLPPQDPMAGMDEEMVGGGNIPLPIGA